jgi:hypothetical protein
MATPLRATMPAGQHAKEFANLIPHVNFTFGGMMQQRLSHTLVHCLRLATPQRRLTTAMEVTSTKNRRLAWLHHLPISVKPMWTAYRQQA